MRKAGQSRELGKERERVVSNRGDRGVQRKWRGEEDQGSEREEEKEGEFREDCGSR